MTFSKNLMAASVVALSTATVAQAGTFTAPIVEAVPVVIVEEASSSSLGSGIWPLAILAILGVGIALASNTN